MGKMSENLWRRIERVQKLVYENYEPGNQSRCKLRAYRRYVLQVYPISERTFWRYMSVDIDAERAAQKPGPG